MIFKNRISGIILGLLALLMTACIQSNLLKNGITEVPAKSKVYKNKVKFDESITHKVNTNVIYEEYDKRYGVLRRLDNHVERSVYGAYRFYPDGRFNKFGLDRKFPLSKEDFNPEYSGSRGVYYLEEDRIRSTLR